MSAAGEVVDLGSRRVTRRRREDDFWNARPLLTDIRDIAAAELISPWGLLGYVLTLASATGDHRVVLPGLDGSLAGASPLNLFLALIGATGDGKGVTAGAARLIDYDTERVLVQTAPTGQGLATAYVEMAQLKGRSKPAELVQHHHNALLTLPEVSVVGQMMTMQNSTLEGTLCQAWSGEVLGQLTSDRGKRRMVQPLTYRLGMWMGVQPPKAGPFIDAAAQGLPQRFLWLPVAQKYDEHAPLRRSAGQVKLPDLPEPSLSTDGWTTMRYHSKIRKEVITARLERSQRDPFDDGIDRSDSHEMLLRLRVAANLAILDQPDGTRRIGEEDWQLSEEIMNVSRRYFERVREVVASSRQQEAADRGHLDAHREMARKATVAEETEKKISQGVRTLLNRADKIGKAGSMTSTQIKDVLGQKYRPYRQQIMECMTGRGYVLTDKNGLQW